MSKIEIYEDGKLIDIDPIAIIAILKPEQLEHGSAFGSYILEKQNILNEYFWRDLPRNLSLAMPHILEARRLAMIEHNREISSQN